MTQVRLPPSTPAAATRREVRPRRGLPNGRAVVGGFLVAVAAVGVFATHASLTSPPSTRYVVAARDLAPGDRVDADALRLVAIALPDEQRRRAYDDLGALIDTTAVESLAAGEVVQEGSIVATNAAPRTRTVSFAVDPSRANDSAVRPGDRLDIFATFGSGTDACTHEVGGHLRVVAVSATDAGVVGQAGGLTITVEVTTADAAASLAHAAAAGVITVARATDAPPADVDSLCTPQPGEQGQAG